MTDSTTESTPESAPRATTASKTEVSNRPVRAQLVRGLADALLEVSEANEGQESMRVLGSALLLDALRERATDIHFEPQGDGLLVRLRIDGRLLDAIFVSRSDGAKIVRHFKAAAGLDTSQHLLPADARISLTLDGRKVVLRLASTPCLGGEALTIRLLDHARLEQHLDQLGLLPDDQQAIVHWLHNACGMFLVAGPTGSGKTTTLYALLQELRSQERAIFTIEDPIEYELRGVTQTQVDHHRGLTIATGLRAMLRLDPDYLLQGEIRDHESARAAAEASASGRVLMSTIHSTDAVGAITVLRNLGLSDAEIATALQVVVGQRLVRRLCPHCRRKVEARPAKGHAGKSVKPAPVAWEPVGCELCHFLGYDGRVGLFEVWILDEDDRALIVGHADEHALRHNLRSSGFRTLVEDGNLKMRDPITSSAEIKQVLANYPQPERRKGRAKREVALPEAKEAIPVDGGA
jgi:type II secretory ATPase GspE/PulE/Tfp pilus assembly ATPase PilB-like protein